MNKNEWRVLPYTFWNIIAEYEFHHAVTVSPFARLLGSYLHTHKDNDRLGIFEVSVGDLAQATGLPFATLKTALSELSNIPYNDTFLIVWDAGLVYTPMILDATIINNLDQRRYLKNRVKSALKYLSHKTEYESQINIAYQAWAIHAQDLIAEVQSDKEFLLAQKLKTASEPTNITVHPDATEQTTAEQVEQITAELLKIPQENRSDLSENHGDLLQNHREKDKTAEIIPINKGKPPNSRELLENHRDFATVEPNSRSFIPNSHANSHFP